MSIYSCTVLPTPEPVAALDRLGDEIAELSAHLEAATARLLTLIREFDAPGGMEPRLPLLRSLAKLAGGPRPRGSARASQGGPRPRGASASGEALARGELSYAKVRALTRVATPETEERLLGVGRAGTAIHVEQIVRGWRYVDRKAEVRETADRHRHRELYLYRGGDGMMVIRGRLEPEVGELLKQALAAARETLYQRARKEGAPRPADSSVLQEQADALALLAETALHQGIDPGTPGERYQVVVHVDAATLMDSDQPGESVLEDGTRVPAETSQRLACDASRVVMQHDAEGRVVEVGARTRTIPPALRRALHYRDRGCRFPGCGVHFGQGHHIRHWAHGGPTTLSNLALLCRRHHRAVHEEGYKVERLPNGVLRFRWPNGKPFPNVPPVAPVPNDPVTALQAQNEAQGLHIHARTGCPTWLGERLDLGWAIHALHPLARGERRSAS